MNKKLVILSAFVSPLRSGAEACAEEVAARLNDHYDITIISARMHSDLPHIDRLPSGVRVWRVGMGIPIDKWLYPFLAARAARALRPDIVHAVLETFAGLALFFCKWTVSDAMRVLTMQTTNRSFLKKPIVRSPHRVTAISSVLADTARRFGRRDVIVIPNGIDRAGIEAATRKFTKVSGRVLFAGRLEKMKGVDVLLRAFHHVVETCDSHVSTTTTGMSLRIVGDGSERATLERQVWELGIRDRVTFVGRVQPEKMAEEYAQAEIFCGLSRSEALGNVFLEAQAAGCAVIATNVGGIPDIVQNGVTGILIPPDDESAAAGALEQLSNNEEDRRRMAEAGRRHAQHYDWGTIAGAYAGIYEHGKNN